MITEIVPVSALRVGDYITEVDTPDGPWYPVVYLDLEQATLTVGADEVDLLIDEPAAVVLRRCAPASSACDPENRDGAL
jgi:hypothetical protein